MQKHASKSLTIAGLVVIVLMFAIDRAGVNVTESEVEGIVTVAGELVGMVMVLVGRWRKGDLYVRKADA